MTRWFILPSSRCSATKQREVIAQHRKPREVIYEAPRQSQRKDMSDREKWVTSLRKGDTAGVAFFFNLAIDPDDLNQVIADLEARGAIIFEAASGRTSADGKALRAMYAEACDVYDGKSLSTEEARQMGKKRAANWDRAKPKPGRMPFSEAQPILCDLKLSISAAIAKINKISGERDPKTKKKRYPTKWTVNFAYRSRDKNLIAFPDRGAGRPRKVQP